MLKKLIIPKEDLKTLEKFLDLQSEQQDFIIQKITEISPGVKINNIIKEITDRTNYRDIREFIKFVINLYINFFHFKSSIEKFIEKVIIHSIILSDSKLKASDGDYSLIKSISKKILSQDKTIGIISKIPYLSNENPNNIIKSHVITDLRYIFYKDPSEYPDYAVIKHTLKIDYLVDDEIKEIFFTLDIKDLSKIKKDIERAFDKEKSLKELCNKNKIKILKEVDLDRE